MTYSRLRDQMEMQIHYSSHIGAAKEIRLPLFRNRQQISKGRTAAAGAAVTK